MGMHLGVGGEILVGNQVPAKAYLDEDDGEGIAVSRGVKIGRGVGWHYSSDVDDVRGNSC
jgi:hypothetical protein